MEAKERHTHFCHRCNYVWISSLEHPKRCTNCKSPYWSTARTRILTPKPIVKRLAEA